VVFKSSSYFKGCVKIKKRNTLVCLDVGTSCIKAALAEVHYGQELNILAVAQRPSFGLRKGNIIDIEATARAINDCLNELERLTGIEIENALVGFSGVNIYAISNHSVVAVGNPNNEISEEDKDRVLQSARNMALPSDKTIIQTIERQYIVDGFDGVKEPIGMVGSRLEVEVVVIVAATAAIQNLYRSAQRINLEIDKVAFRPVIEAEAVLLESEMEMGVALVDIGGGTTEISFFEGGSLFNTSVLPVGGEYITKDLAIVLRTSIEEAKRVKEQFGVASAVKARNDLMVNVKSIHGKEVKQYSQQVIADIISARVLEIVEMIYAELREFGCLEKLPGGIVLTGGEAQLQGIAEFMEEYMQIPVRIGTPENIRGIQTDYNKPQYASVIGGLIYTAKSANYYDEENPRFSSIIDRITFWFKDLFR
jgi:cell division protein FtsA